ncbi:ATP-binding protein [Bdellovibrionota bacterium FG-2]
MGLGPADLRVLESLGALPDGICVVDSEFRVVYWNSVLERSSGVLSAEIVGQELFSRFKNLNVRKYLVRFKAVMDTGGPAIFSPDLHQYLIPCPLANGKFQVQECFFSRLTLSNIPGSAVSGDLGGLTIRDVTASYGKIHELRRLANLKDKFLAVCSHDLRAPLNVILGFTEILGLDEEVKAKHTETLCQIQGAGVLLLNFINELLDLGRLQSKGTKSVKGALFLADVAKTSYDLMRVLAAGKNIRLVFEDKTSNRGPVRGNLSELTRIINNLLSNAIKFTPAAGKIVLGLELNAEASEVMFSVQDSGRGIPKDKVPVLFDRYTTASRAGTAGEASTGIGLSIVKELVEVHHGRIEVESVEGQGSCFRVILPLRALSSLEQSAHAEVLFLQKKDLPLVTDEVSTTKRILIVDDDQANRLLLQAYLARTSHLIEQAEDGVSAFEKFTTRSYDMLLVDRMMPGMDGPTLTKKIRAWEKERMRTPVPVVVITGHTSPEELETALNAGCNSYLNKPVSRAKLLETISQY